MNKIFLATTMFLSVAMASFAQSKLKLHVTSLPDGTTLEASLGSTHQNEKAIATATVNNSWADFDLPVNEPRMIDIHVQGSPGNILHFMTTKGENVQAFSTVSKNTYDNKTYYSSSKEEVLNSPTEAQYMMRLGAFKDYVTSYNKAYHDGYREINDKVNQAYNAKDTAAINRLKATKEYQDFLACDKQFFDMLNKEYPRLFAENKDSWWGALMPLDVYSYFSKENASVYDQLSDEAKNSFYGQLLKEQVHPKGLVGEVYPKFNYTDSKGKNTQVTKVTKGKKYLLIDFWASWCRPCRKEIPNLKNCYTQYKNKGLQIVSVSIDTNDAAWQKALAEEKLPWPNGIDKSKVADVYKVQFIPAMFLVDLSTGKIIADNLRGQSLRDKLAELMK